MIPRFKSDMSVLPQFQLDCSFAVGGWQCLFTAITDLVNNLAAAISGGEWLWGGFTGFLKKT